MWASLDMSDPDVKAIVPKMKRGDLDKMLFAFIPIRQKWDDREKMPRRTIEEAELYDVNMAGSCPGDCQKIAGRSSKSKQKKPSATPCAHESALAIKASLMRFFH